MAYGPGKYDKEAMEILERTKAQGVLLMVFNGDRGNGFSMDADINLMLSIPAILRAIAKQIEEDLIAQ